MTKNEYLLKLKKLHDSIPSEYERAIFFILCKKYQDYLKGITDTKYTTKEEILQKLISKGLATMRVDKKTGEQKLPDDRSVRSAVRKLMKNGLPILSSSTCAGYYICDTQAEIEQPYNENKKRALSILARQKGFEMMSKFINGQMEITEINLNIDDEDME